MSCYHVFICYPCFFYFILLSPQMAAMAFSAESNFSTAASACTTRKFSRSSAVQTSCQVKGVWVTIHWHCKRLHQSQRSQRDPFPKILLAFTGEISMINQHDVQGASSFAGVVVVSVAVLEVAVAEVLVVVV